MRIGFDAKRLFTNATGLHNYAYNITDALVRYYPQHTFMFFTPKFSERFYSTIPFLQLPHVEVVSPEGFFYKKFHSLWRSSGVIKSIQHKKTDIYHGLSNEIPVKLHKHTKTVVTIHDVIFKHFPEYYRMADRRMYDVKTRYAVKHAHAVIAANNRTKKDLMELYNGKPEDIHCIEQPCSPIYHIPYSTQRLEEIQKDLNLPEKFMLYVGTIEARKNLVLLVKAIAALPLEKRPHLVVVGKATSYLDTVREEIEALKLGTYIHFYHNIPSEQLPALYHMAKLYVNPSIMEGFGIPILEALTCGTPVLCSDRDYFKDTFEERCTYASVDNVNEWIEKIESLYLSDFKPMYNLDRFTHEAVAHRIMHLYESLL